jgi:hypothetical protein
MSIHVHFGMDVSGDDDVVYLKSADMDKEEPPFNLPRKAAMCVGQLRVRGRMGLTAARQQDEHDHIKHFGG